MAPVGAAVGVGGAEANPMIGEPVAAVAGIGAGDAQAPAEANARIATSGTLSRRRAFTVKPSMISFATMSILGAPRR